MGNGFTYPSVEKVEEYNLLALALIKVKKADSHKVLSRHKIRSAIGESKAAEGDVYTKAAVLIRALVRAHAFASGNRRTAFITAKSFVLSNEGRFRIADDPHYAKVMRGIREDYYTLDEIKEWIQHGKIREFKRSV